jgi:hypothetical protein
MPTLIFASTGIVNNGSRRNLIVGVSLMQKTEFSGKFTARLLRSLEVAGLEVDVSFDLSRNRHFSISVHEGPVTRRIAAQSPDLHLIIRAGTCDSRRYNGLRAAWLNRRLAEFIAVIEENGGFRMLGARGFSIRCTNFDTGLLNLRQPPLAIRNAVAAIQSPTAEHFNQLPPQTRAAMGIYRRISHQRYVRVGAPSHPAPTATDDGFTDHEARSVGSKRWCENLVGPAGLEPATKAL